MANENEISMTLRQRVEHANLMPVLGSLQQEKEAKALRFKFMDGLAKSQLDAWKIQKDENGRYSFTDSSQADTPTIVKLSDDEVFYFQSFISNLDRQKAVHIKDVTLYEIILQMNPVKTGDEE